MKKIILVSLLSLVSVSASEAQTISFSYPFINPFGEKLCECPYGVISYSRMIGDNWSFFGLLGSSVHEDTRTVTFASFGRNVTVSKRISARIAVGDFRAFSPGVFLHWGNVYGHVNVTAWGGVFSLISDVYMPVNDGGFMNLTGLGYTTPEVIGVTLKTRVGYVNYAKGWQWDTRLDIPVGSSNMFLRGVYGYNSNVSLGTSWTF